MAGSTIGQLFRLTNFGESHGAAIGCIIDGCPPNIPFDQAFIQQQLNRRKPGQSKFVTQRREADHFEVLSGVFENKTTGTPIAIHIKNTDQRSKDYSDIKDKFRPGHADFTYHHKYGIRDYRGGGRSSARETAVRVVGGAIAQMFLRQVCKFKISGYLTRIGTIALATKQIEQAQNNAFNSPDPDKIPDLEQYIQQLQRDGNSCGAEIEVIASGVPIGLGEPVFDRLEADIAKAMMSINAVKAVAIGGGFECAQALGSAFRDEITPTGFSSNYNGGVLGGISTGQDIHVKLRIKPTSSIRIAANTIDVDNNPTTIVTKGRHDPCVGIRAVVIAEAMLALTIADHFLRYQAYKS